MMTSLQFWKKRLESWRNRRVPTTVPGSANIWPPQESMTLALGARVSLIGDASKSESPVSGHGPLLGRNPPLKSTTRAGVLGGWYITQKWDGSDIYLS